MADGIEDLLLEGLTAAQAEAVRSRQRRLLVVAGAGSGKTEVMARRVAWWVAVEGVPPGQVVAFTFTEKAAREMRARIRRALALASHGDLGDMFVGTIHAFCLAQLRALAPERYHNYEVLDELARLALIQREYDLLGFYPFTRATTGTWYRYRAIERFLQGYDLLCEHGELRVELPPAPAHTRADKEWYRRARLLTPVGRSELAEAFSRVAARYYACLHLHRCLDFSTSQNELVRMLEREEYLARLRGAITHVVVDECQDINPVQDRLIRLLVGDCGHLLAVGDHRQAIYAWRGGRVELMARLHAEVAADPEGGVIELAENFRSTPRIVALANAWARKIGDTGGMPSPDMLHGRAGRRDESPAHVALMRSYSRQLEAEGIAQVVRALVPGDGRGAAHDDGDGERGLTYADVAVLLRSRRDLATYVEALERRGIPVVVRGSPQLLLQPEVLLCVAALALVAGRQELVDQRYGEEREAIAQAVGCGWDAGAPAILEAACRRARATGLPLRRGVEYRLARLAQAVRSRLAGGPRPSRRELRGLRSAPTRDWLAAQRFPREVFLQEVLHHLLAEAEVGAWDASGAPRARAAMYHLGQLSSMLASLNLTGPSDLELLGHQVETLCLWSLGRPRLEEHPLAEGLDAVTVSTIHAAKGLEFPAVVVADVSERRFPSSLATQRPNLPFDHELWERLQLWQLSDNEHLDGERRLLYVALTRAERYLLVSASSPSGFFWELAELAEREGVPSASPAEVARHLRLRPSARSLRPQLSEAFSSLRYYLECPHDYYLRRLLGFRPVVNEYLGYGQGLHNLLREIHSQPQHWARLAEDEARLRAELDRLIAGGLFFLRYASPETRRRLQARALELVAGYVREHAGELGVRRYEPERPFEVLLEEDVLLAGAVDLLEGGEELAVVDFKSGEAGAYDEELLRLQVQLYALALGRATGRAPQVGLVRFVGGEGPAEMRVELGPEALRRALELAGEAAQGIREGRFDEGPTPRHVGRCARCDFRLFCGLGAMDRPA